MPYTIPSYTVSPGAVYQPRKSKLILDQIPGAIAAWSTRRLISSAPADIARGRDASTTEQDFTAAELAGTGFTTLAGAGDGFYVTLYDQIGSNNATQSTAASQPKGVDTGTLITDGTVPVLDFDGSDDFLVTPNNSDLNILGDLSLYFQISTSTTSICLIYTGYNSSLPYNGFGVGLKITGVSTTDRELCVWTSLSWVATGDIIPDSDFTDVCVTYRSSDNQIFVYFNGVLQSTSSGNEVLSYIGQRIIGGGHAGATPFPGKLNNIIVFNKLLTASEVSQLHSALT